METPNCGGGDSPHPIRRRTWAIGTGSGRGLARAKTRNPRAIDSRRPTGNAAVARKISESKAPRCCRSKDRPQLPSHAKLVGHTVCVRECIELRPSGVLDVDAVHQQFLCAQMLEFARVEDLSEALGGR